MATLGRTDLAVELQATQDEGTMPKGIQIHTKLHGKDIKETVISVKTDEAAVWLGKPKGTYVTIESQELAQMDVSYHEQVTEVLKEQLACFMKGHRHIMVVGLGNRQVTPDALGPRVVDQLCVTRHLIEQDILAARYMYTALAPGVMAQTGMEMGELLKGAIGQVHPDMLLVVDALAARDANRLNQTIQISDTGIVPGSGVGNHRSAVTEETMGIPVVALGVPTVISVPAILDEAMDGIIHNFGKQGMDKVLQGFDERERYALAKELLKPQLAEMFVTPKDIDSAVKRISYTISEALNQMLGLDHSILAYIQ